MYSIAKNGNEDIKIKVVTDSDNVPLGEAEIGELFFDIDADRLYIRLVSGWKYIAITG